jgi:hypothetical protein
VELQEALKRYTDRVPQEDLRALRWAYELIVKAGLSVGEQGKDWVYDGHDEICVDGFDEYDYFERLAMKLLFPPLSIVVNEAYGVKYTSELDYRHALDEEDRVEKLLLSWIADQLS